MDNLFRKTIFYVVILFILGAVCALAWLNHNDFKKTMVKLAQSQLFTIARAEAQSIEKYIKDIYQELEIVSSDYAIRKLLSGKENGGMSNEYKRYLEKSFRDVEELVDVIYLIDANGKVVDVSPFRASIVGKNISEISEAKFVLGKKEFYTSSVFRTSSGKLVIANIYPIFDEGNYLGFLRADILLERIDSLVSHINQGDTRYAFLLDSSATLLSYHDTSYVGKNIGSLLNEKLTMSDLPELKRIAGRMASGKEGMDMFAGVSSEALPKTEKILLAYAPIRIGSTVWSIAVAMNYDAISGPINRNTRDNLIFAGFVLLIFLILGISFYTAQKKKDELAISEAALNIINKQLHLEIGERKKIEERLERSLRKKAG